jgi:glutamate N-acetyltransferase / amino-acid N-acetyltransferase
MPKLSPLAPDAFPILPAMAGVRFATAACGLRYKGRTDLLLVELSPQTTVAGVFTRSLTASAPVDWCRKALKGGKARAIVVNSGNANAFTGKAGDAAVAQTVAGVADLVKCAPEEIFVASTGVIGEALDASKIVGALPGLRAKLSAAAWEDAARAIMTTDTFPKGATRRARIGETVVTVSGFCKGSGMIAPDMATMLAFVFTDAKLSASVLRSCLASANACSFNAITVDGDTSTSDTVLLCATGEATNKRVARPSDRVLTDFRRALDEVMLDLAHQVVKDGEGAEKFVAIRVTGAASARAARAIGMAIANSPLVKTAIAGEDANWGRIVGAVGKAGQRASRDRLKIAIGGVTIAENGAAVPKYDEAPVVAHMKGRDIKIAVDVGIGRGRATVWTCDLTHGYIDINGSYRS